MPIKNILLIFSVIMITTTSTAHAYLDPISASILFQSIIAALAAAIFVIKTKFRQIKNFFLKKKDKKETDKKETEDKESDNNNDDKTPKE